MDWVASSGGSGFVSSCACGFQTQAHGRREDAIAEMSGHVVAAFSAPRPRRWGRKHAAVVDLRDTIRAR